MKQAIAIGARRMTIETSFIVTWNTPSMDSCRRFEVGVFTSSRPMPKNNAKNRKNQTPANVDNRFTPRTQIPDYEDDEKNHAAIALTVTPELRPPEGGVALGLRAVPRAAMPETTVDEDHEPPGAEDEVGPHAERQAPGVATTDGLLPAPAGPALGP